MTEHEKTLCPELRSEPKIGCSFEDNSEEIFLFCNKNICCDPSLELSQWDSSTERSQYMLNVELWKISLN